MDLIVTSSGGPLEVLRRAHRRALANSRRSDIPADQIVTVTERKGMTGTSAFNGR